VNLQGLSIAQIRNYLKQLYSQESFIVSEHDDRYKVLEGIVKHLEKDNRKGSKNLLNFANRIIGSQTHWHQMMAHETELIGKGYNLIGGVDEVGRGPLAGPVVSASVILDPSVFIPGINDSKKLSESKRESLYAKIQQKAIAIGIGIINAETIDRINILRASLEAMCQAVASLSIQPDFLLVDGQHCPNLNIPMKPIIGGDGLSLSIAAASIIAKVTRDRIMDDLDKVYLNYGFSRNKGYPTPDHFSALERFGPCEIHRKSFAPVAEKLRQP
jgi:ribonuclease HII